MNDCERCIEFRRALAEPKNSGMLRTLLLEERDAHQAEHAAGRLAAARIESQAA